MFLKLFCETQKTEQLNSRIVKLEGLMLQSTNTNGNSTLQTSNPESQTLLGQNIPNPFNNSTIIPFRITKECHSATIIILEATGKIVKAVPVPVSCNETQLIVEAGTLAAGKYSYSLVVDGITVDTKYFSVMR